MQAVEMLIGKSGPEGGSGKPNKYNVCRLKASSKNPIKKAKQLGFVEVFERMFKRESPLDPFRPKLGAILTPS